LLTSLCVGTFVLNARLVSRVHVRSAVGTDPGSTTGATGSENPTRKDETSRTTTGADKDRPDSFSSCLLWMDDNFRMPEWLAYHYYVMNLRYLVIHPDPRSRTSPSPVLDRWRDRIHIVEWTDPSQFTDAVYFDLDTVQEGDESNRNRTEFIWEQTQQLVHRQVDFYQACGMHMRSHNRTWTSFHDNDEFLVVVSQTIRGNVTFSRRGGGEDGDDNATEARTEKVEAGMALKVLQRYARGGGAVQGSSSATAAHEATLYEAHRNWDLWFSALPCVVLPRALMGAVASPDADVERDVPQGLDAHRFDTLRWRIQGTGRDDGDGPGKAIVDVSRLPAHAIDVASSGNGTTSPHRPFRDLCTNGWAPSNGLPLAFHHYLGSWEEFSHRDDIRKGLDRSLLKWEDKSELRYGGVNDDARHGILGFVDMVGEHVAAELLRDAGLPRDYAKPPHETAGWEFIGSARTW
jgi:hypothetical protein